MDIGGIFGLSLVSKRSKQLVSSAGIKATSIGVRIGEYVTIEVEISRTNRICLDFLVKQDLRVPESVYIYFDGAENPEEEEEEKKLECPIFEFQDWLEHLRAVFNCQGVEFLEFYEGSSRFDLQQIKEHFGKVDHFSLLHSGCYTHNQLILQEFSPINSLSIYTNAFEDSRVPSNILIQNFESLVVHKEDMESKEIGLNDLLLMNGKQIDIINLLITPKDFNRFLKLWIKGANPQMEYLCIPFANDIIVDENELMKGIKHQKFPSDRTRIFHCTGSWDDNTMKGGFDIQRKNGLKATINVTYDDEENYFEIFVWQETCVLIEV